MTIKLNSISVITIALLIAVWLLNRSSAKKLKPISKAHVIQKMNDDAFDKGQRTWDKVMGS